MKKAFLKKIVIAAFAATTLTSIAPLGVSAATTNLSLNNYYQNNANGWVNNNGSWSYLDKNGVKQTGVINVNGKVYYLNENGIMQTGKVSINNKTYIFDSNGQAIGNNCPNVDKVFDCQNNIIKDETTGSDTNANVNTDKDPEAQNGTNSNSTNNENNTNNSTSTSDSSLDVEGLDKLPSNYSVTIQAEAEQKILELMNEKRKEAGLSPLTLDDTLVKVARYKSNNMIQNNFFDHTNPDGTKWVNWLQTLGYQYNTTGENIAYNTYDPVELFTQWWNSEGHRANMMNSSYTKVGIGVIYGNGKYMGTQTFSG